MLMIPVSTGELIDKITILRLKQQHLKGAARANVERELAMLESAYAEASLAVPPDLWQQLQAVNRALWGVENAIRACEADGDFGAEFVVLARQVYTLNDQRAQLKRSINQWSDSPLVEEKSYGSAPASPQEAPGDQPPH